MTPQVVRRWRPWPAGAVTGSSSNRRNRITERSVSIIDIGRMLEEGTSTRRVAVERFEDRHIIVTGGGSGIGRATVLRLLARGGDRPHRRRRRAAASSTPPSWPMPRASVGVSPPRCSTSPTSRRSTPACAPTVDAARRPRRAGERGRHPARREHARVHARHVEPGDRHQPHRHVPHVPRRDPGDARVGRTA